jgi:hypothetical protein
MSLTPKQYRERFGVNGPTTMQDPHEGPAVVATIQGVV